LTTLLDWFGRNGYLAVFLAVGLELVGIPFPAETILLTAGATAATGRLELPVVMLLAAVAAVLGASVGYTIGWVGGRPLLDRLVARGWPRQQQLLRIEGFVHRHGGKALVTARFIPFVRIFAPWMAGATRMPLQRFAVWNVAGGIAWVVVVTLCGYLFAASVGAIEQALGPGAAIVVGVAVVAALIWHRVRRHD
jgi:membrane-associated protein